MVDVREVDFEDNDYPIVKRCHGLKISNIDKNITYCIDFDTMLRTQNFKVIKQYQTINLRRDY